MPQSVQEVIKDPNFLGLPYSEQVKVMRALDSNYAGLPETEQIRVLDGLKKPSAPSAHVFTEEEKRASSAARTGSWDAPSATEKFFTDHPVITAPLTQAAKFGEGVVDAVKGTATSAYQALTNPTAAGMGMLQAQREQFTKAADSYKQGEVALRAGNKGEGYGHGYEALGHAVAGAVPLFGPMAAHIGERAGSGDIAGAAGEGLTYAMLPKVMEEAPGLASKAREGFANTARAAAKTVTSADTMMERAAGNRSINPSRGTTAIDATIASTTGVPTAVVKIVRSAASKLYGEPMATAQEGIARWMEKDAKFPEDNLPTPEPFNVPEPSGAPREAIGGGSLRTRTIENRPPPSAPAESAEAFPNVKGNTPQPYRTPYNPMRDIPDIADQGIPDTELVTRPPSGPSEPLPPFTPSTEIAAKPPARGATPEAVNKWMGISSKEVLHGANPGQQLIDEGLLGATKTETQAKVKAALDHAGEAIGKQLKAATDKGVTIDAQTPVYDSLAAATKKIGSPRDATFQAQLNGILDDIEGRYADLHKLSPEQTHALKVDVGDSIKWSGPSYADPINQVLIRIYRDLNSAIKMDVDGITPAQSRWGNLYIASKSIAQGIAKDIVGKGTGQKPAPSMLDSARARMAIKAANARKAPL